MIRIVCAVTIALMLGCSASTSSTNPKIPNFTKIDSVELFPSRASLQKTEYEQLKLVQNNLFAECGRIRNGRLYTLSQGLEPLGEADAERVREALHTVIETYNESSSGLDEPGESDTPVDPGQYLLSFRSDGKQIDLKTSLDSVSEPTTSSERELLALANTLRTAAGSSLCTARDFYGIGNVTRGVSKPLE